MRSLRLLVPVVLLLCAVAGFLRTGREEGRPSPAEGETIPGPDQNRNQNRNGEFRQWVRGQQREALTGAALAEGIQLAEERGRAMARLIRSDPAAALAAALPLTEYRRLPPAIRERIEQPFAMTAEAEVTVTCGRAGQTGTGPPAPAAPAAEGTYISVNGRRCRLYLPAGRAGLLSKTVVPLTGIRVQGVAAADRSPVRRLAPEEVTAAAEVYGLPPPGAEPQSSQTVAAVIGGSVVRLPEAMLTRVEAALRQAEQLPGPWNAAKLLAAAGGTPGAPGWEEALGDPPLASSSWTETPKRVLYIRVDFADRPGAPVSIEALTEAANAGAAQISRMSYGKTTIIPTVTPKVYRLGAAAKTDAESLAAAARKAAGADHMLSAYDIHVFCFAPLPFPWSGLATVSGNSQWLNGVFTREVIVHETGHNYGIFHANFWDTATGENPAAANGTVREYGDLFDVMGSGPGDYNVRHKMSLHWLEAANRRDITEEGTCRLYNFEDRLARGVAGDRALVLQVQRTDGEVASSACWLGLRGGAAGGGLLPSGRGLTVIQEPPPFFQVPGTLLLDMTPGREPVLSAELADAPLKLFQTFTDPTGLVSVTPVATGGAGPDEWVDVAVRFQNTGNRTPAVTLSGPRAGFAGVPLRFTATAEDADGDTVLYAWDPGDGVEAPGPSVLTHAWSAPGSATVTVRALDLRGGAAAASQTLTILPPDAGWAAWTQAHFPEGGDSAQPGADADGDRWENALEFALGTDPAGAGDHPAMTVTVEEGYLTLTVTGFRTGGGMTWRLERAAQPEGPWSDAGPVTTGSDPGFLEGRSSAPVRPGAREFLRLRVAPGVL